MKELLDKLTSYNLFNYLLPGIVFVVFAGRLTKFSFVQNDLVIAAFTYYFIGLIISRLGSLFIEPTLKRIKFVRFADYKDFVNAAKVDPKIEILSECNNSYRTISALFVALLILKMYEQAVKRIPWLSAYGLITLIVLLFVMFLFAYRKQTSYIAKRIETNLRQQAKGTNE